MFPKSVAPVISPVAKLEAPAALAPIAVLKSASLNAETVLSAFNLGNVTALGLVNVNKLAPTVVAPNPVLAPLAVVEPVPPLDIARVEDKPPAVPVVFSFCNAKVPWVLGNVIVISLLDPLGLPPTNVVSLLSAVEPSKTTPLLVDTVSTLFVVTVPVTVKLPGIETAVLPSPIVRALLGIAALRAE